MFTWVLKPFLKIMKKISIIEIINTWRKNKMKKKKTPLYYPVGEMYLSLGFKKKAWLYDIHIIYLYFNIKVGGTSSSDSHGTTDKWAPCSAETPGAVAMTYLDMEADDILLQNVSMVRRKGIRIYLVKSLSKRNAGISLHFQGPCFHIFMIM